MVSCPAGEPWLREEQIEQGCCQYGKKAENTKRRHR